MSHVIELIDPSRSLYFVDGMGVALGNDTQHEEIPDPFEPDFRDVLGCTIAADESMGIPFPRQRLAVASLSRLQELARASREQIALSYRGFLVGAAALAVTETGLAHFFVGGNIKPTPDSPKFCAETMINRKASAANAYRAQLHGNSSLWKVVALAVQGPSDFSSVYDIETITLHPCSNCQQTMQESPIFDDDCLVVTTVDRADGSGIITELHTLPQIVDFHKIK